MKAYLKKVWRGLIKNSGNTVINITGLSVGLSAAILILLWVQNEFSFDNNHPDSGQIYFVKTKIIISKTETWLWDHTSFVLGTNAKQIGGVDEVTRLKPVNYTELTFKYQDKLFGEKKCAYVDKQWFNLFKYDFIEGSEYNFNRNPFSLIMTEEAAKKYFGNQSAVGKSLRLDSVNYQVQGVVKKSPANSSFQFDIMIPSEAEFTGPDGRKMMTDWGSSNYMVFVKIAKGTNISKTSATLNQLYHENRKDDSGTSFSLEPLKKLHFSDDLTSSGVEHGNQKTVNVFLIIAVLLLLIASINYVNLNTAHASTRAKEVGVRKIIGASRFSIFWQFVIESLFLSFIALAVALVIVQITMPLFRVFTEKDFGQPLLMPALWEICGITLLLVFLMNSIYPALLLSSFKPINVLKGKLMLNIKDAYFRRILVMFQVTVAALLIIGTLVIYLQLRFIDHTELGYSRQQIFSLEIPWQSLGSDAKKRETLLNSIKNDLTSNSSILGVSVASKNFIDLKNRNSGSFDWNGRPADFQPSIAPLEIDASFPALAQLKLKEGRWLSGTGADIHNVVLNETAVAELHLFTPVIGQRFVHQGDTGIVVGVVKDFHFNSLRDKIEPMVIADQPGLANTIYVKTAGGRVNDAIEKARTVWAQHLPNQPFTFSYLDDAYNNLYRKENKSSVLITFFATLTIIISAMGLFALASFAAQKRLKEVAIRKVLGAKVVTIISLLSKDFAMIIIIANIIALPIGWYFMKNWLENFSYRINLSWWIFGIATLSTMMISILPVCLQGVKAAITKTVKLLKAE